MNIAGEMLCFVVLILKIADSNLQSYTYHQCLNKEDPRCQLKTLKTLQSKRIKRNSELLFSPESLENATLELPFKGEQILGISLDLLTLSLGDYLISEVFIFMDDDFFSNFAQIKEYSKFVMVISKFNIKVSRVLKEKNSGAWELPEPDFRTAFIVLANKSSFIEVNNYDTKQSIDVTVHAILDS